ncbi:MAG: maleylpyruvate isomerase N-terminal domain-containing protein [Mycobacterium sp.]|nr:maleylpyruvate isomerase N-terminal domain-containing protein [Mycobacterium sp.]
MNGTEYVALVDTTRDELRERIGRARDRFDRLVRAADPHARVPGLDWTVHQVVAHVLSVAHRYQAVAEGREFRRASYARELDEINRAELDALMAPIPEIANHLNALAPAMDALFDTCSNERVYELHCGALADGVTAQTNWLGELVLHGRDVARAIGTPWGIEERDMLLVARGLMQYGEGPGYLRAGLPAGIAVCLALKVPHARPYVIHIHDGAAEMRERRRDDRPDAVLRTPASTLCDVIYQRIGPVTAVRRGLRIVGGRRPWKALKLQSYLERP